MLFSGCVWRPLTVVENWSAVALQATSSSRSRKIRSGRFIRSNGWWVNDQSHLIWASSLLHLLSQEYVVMNLDSRLLSFPLYVCCNFLYTSAHSDQRPESSEQESGTHVSWCSAEQPQTAATPLLMLTRHERDWMVISRDFNVGHVH